MSVARHLAIVPLIAIVALAAACSPTTTGLTTYSGHSANVFVGPGITDFEDVGVMTACSFSGRSITVSVNEPAAFWDDLATALGYSVPLQLTTVGGTPIPFFDADAPASPVDGSTEAEPTVTTTAIPSGTCFQVRLANFYEGFDFTVTH